MTDATQRKATVTSQGDRQFVVVREFEAPREEVFRTMTDPELVPEWWGPHGVTTRVEEMDVRAGGRWRFVCVNDDGSEDGFRGTYREIQAPERIVQTFEWDGMPGHISVEDAVFEDLGERTRMTSTSTFHFAEERDGMLASGMEGGMNETYERLDAVLAKRAGG